MIHPIELEKPDVCHGWSEIGDAVNISAQQARHWARAGLLPVFHNGRRVCAFRASLIAALAAREAEAIKPKAVIDD